PLLSLCDSPTAVGRMTVISSGQQRPRERFAPGASSTTLGRDMTHQGTRVRMTDPTITCPHCHTEIKLTESLAAPLLEATRQQYEKKISDKEAEVARREAAIKDQQAAVAKSKEAIDEEVANKLKQGRATIAAEEARKARQFLANDIETKAKELAE